MNEIERAIGAAVASVVAFLALVWRTWINPMKIEASEVAAWRKGVDITVGELRRRQDVTDTMLSHIQMALGRANESLARIEGRFGKDL